MSKFSQPAPDADADADEATIPGQGGETCPLHNQYLPCRHRSHSAGTEASKQEQRPEPWEEIGWPREAWDAFAWGIAMTADPTFTSARMTDVFGLNEESNPRGAVKQAFIKQMQSCRDDLKASDDDEIKAQEKADAEARRRDAAREKVKREKMERRLSGELDAAAQCFLDAFESDGLMGVDAMLSVKRPEALIDGLLYTDSLAWLAGPSNTYKSFLALDIAARAAFGMTYHGDDRPMAIVASLVIVAEGAGAYGDRIRAWERKNGRKIPRDQVMFYPRAVQLSDLVVEMPALLAHVKRQREQGTGYGLIIFDTQAMCTVGVSENDNTEMGVVMNVLHQLREATGACILLVHHFGADDAKGMRGATAIYAAATTVIAVKRKDDLKVVLSTRAPKGKQKDAEAMDAFLLDLEKVGDAEQGWSSLAPTRATHSGSKVQHTPEVNARQLLILSILAATDEVGGLGVSAIARHVTEEEGPNPKTAKPWAPSTTASWMDTLVRKDLVKKTGTSYTITDIGKDALTDGPIGEDNDR
ncbi:AAA family ATPase [Streptomyces coeruleorubidus]|uniref:AAA family ATPase n=1 Tax=Streptomyces coeruleorubidus TaxID=116188 RepID=A0A5J6I0Y7_STRC4|nr:AAA family ATPase [Streptomyces coeruleorubidus]QEV25658.1 hypothetical protein CP976_16855 [Streptomyces coeruleorubidus]GGT48969.1 hypothetical protein GCM10010256_01450 [Streptomyces coeruleorubidus]